MWKSKSDWIWGDEGEIPSTFALGNQVNDNGDIINQQNGIKCKNKLFYDNLKQFHYKTHLFIMNHFFICYILNDNLCSLQVGREEIMRTAVGWSVNWRWGVRASEYKNFFMKFAIGRRYAAVGWKDTIEWRVYNRMRDFVKVYRL